MHELSLEPWTHRHLFLGAHHDEHARRTRWVVALTFGMMVVEVVGGVLTGSMALLADGLHMSTHAAAIGIATLAYGYAKTHGHSEPGQPGRSSGGRRSLKARYSSRS